MERLAQRGKGGVNGDARATTWPDASATLAVRALACMCTSWACLGITFLARPMHQIVEADVHSTQGSVEHLLDMVGRVGEGQG